MDEAELLWNAVDTYAAEQLLEPDAALAAVRADSAAAGLPEIAVSPMQGKLLQLMVGMQGAHRVLEVGTLGGYSTVWLARGLPEDGQVVTVEVDPHHAEVARANLAHAGVDDRVEVIVGPGLDVLPQLVDGPPFDFVFLDADKPNNAAYLGWALRLTHPGAVIIVDNVVRRGGLADAASEDPAVQGARKVLDAVRAEARLSATVVQTVGSKGYDGFLLARVLD
ncbi:MAG: O-methyltransferase [Mycobacteriaceae bacterium]